MSNGSILPLRLTDVSFAAGGRTIIDRISLEIGSGPSTIILGANGAGKSVLMRLMHGLLSPISGSIEWNAPERSGAPRKQAMVFQRPVMLRRSAHANVAYALKIAGVPEPQRGVAVAAEAPQPGSGAGWFTAILEAPAGAGLANRRDMKSARSADISASALYMRWSSRFCRRMSMMKAIPGLRAVT